MSSNDELVALFKNQIDVEERIVESVKAAFDIYAPFSGKVVEVNSELEADPALVNNDPYGKGWLFKMESVRTEEYDALMDAHAYAKHVAEAVH